MLNRTMGHGVLALAIAVGMTVAGCKKSETKERAEPAAEQGTGTGTAAIETADVTYSAGSTILKGYIAAPKGPGKHPGILVIHEWWGQNDYVKMRARKLAELGYVALALDMYGEGKTVETPAEAQQLAGEALADPAVAMARLMAAREVLAGDPRVDADKLGAIGYCFGGSVVLAAARAGVDLDVVASFHGTLVTPAPMTKGKFAGTVLVATGGADPMVPPADVEAIKQELTAAGVDHEVVVYEGATHAFTNPAATATGEKFDLPVRYDAAADEASWKALGAVLAKTWPGA